MPTFTFSKAKQTRNSHSSPKDFIIISNYYFLARKGNSGSKSSSTSQQIFQVRRKNKCLQYPITTFALCSKIVRNDGINSLVHKNIHPMKANQNEISNPKKHSNAERTTSKKRTLHPKYHTSSRTNYPPNLPGKSQVEYLMIPDICARASIPQWIVTRTPFELSFGMTNRYPCTGVTSDLSVSYNFNSGAPGRKIWARMWKVSIQTKLQSELPLVFFLKPRIKERKGEGRGVKAR